ncbi:MAG: nicotinamide-nucleotide amidohydrolase family protein [Burkholderiales bacterium]
MDAHLYDLAERVGIALKGAGLLLATAESCTGGWVGQAVTMVPGSSDWYDRGFITYTNAAKREMLGVMPETLDGFGAVSEPAVREMARGALDHSRAQVAVAVSGIAGPSGGSADKPVGTVCLAWARVDGTVWSETRCFEGDRDAVRRQSVARALERLLDLLGRTEVA